MFRTKYDRVEIFSDPGSSVKEDYVAEFDKSGVIELVKTGEHSLYDEIQSHRDSCDLQIILKRFLESGDESILARKQGMYGDFTTMPKTYMEMLNMAIRAEQEFNNLPIDVKQRFDNNYALWLNEVNTENWYRKMGFTPKESQVEKSSNDSEVKSDD